MSFSGAKQASLQGWSQQGIRPVDREYFVTILAFREELLCLLIQATNRSDLRAVKTSVETTLNTRP
jgi:hypothetical protein